MKRDSTWWSGSQAILIGVSTYRDHRLPHIPAAANSLRQLRAVLTDPQLCGWPAGQITVLADPCDSRGVALQIRRLAQETTGVLLLYYVGHGTVTPGGELCLTLSDTEAEAPDLTGVEYARIRSAFGDSPARVKASILDCCYSGRAIETLTDQASVVADHTDIRGVYTLTASDLAAHVPPPEKQVTACTSFTGELVDLVRTGISGQPDPLTLGTLYLELRRRLRARGLPDPNQRGTDTAHSFAFTRNAAAVAPVLHEPGGTATDTPRSVVGRSALLLMDASRRSEETVPKSGSPESPTPPQRAGREQQVYRRLERNKRIAVIGSTMGVVAVVGGIVAAVVLLSGGDDPTGAAPSPSAQASTSASTAAQPKPYDEKTGTCGYAADTLGGPVKDVGMPPTAVELEPARKTMTMKTNLGDIVVELDNAKAPCTVNSLQFLAEKDYYDGSKCHRLGNDKFPMLQCGDPTAKADGRSTGDGSGGPGYVMVEENLEGAVYKRGVMAMAKTQAPGSTGSQFFLVYGDIEVNPLYTPVGTIKKGLDILDEVNKASIISDTGDGTGAPKEAVEIKDVTVTGMN